MKLDVQSLSVTLGKTTILKNASFSIDSGEFVGIIGPNGSGKTTLLKTLRGLYPTSGGDVLWDGKSISSLSDKEIAHHVAYMQQSVNVSFDYEAIDIVMTARYPYLKWWEQEGPEDKVIVAAWRVQGQVDVPLNEQGRAQAQAAAAGLAALHPALLAASPLGRAQETAEALAGLTGLGVVTAEGLAERSFGVWEGLNRADMKSGWPEQYERWRAGQDPEGVDVEPRARVAERVGGTLAALAEQAGEGDVVVAVAHGAAITLGGIFYE